jgi:hypothetical protein
VVVVRDVGGFLTFCCIRIVELERIPRVTHTCLFVTEKACISVSAVIRLRVEEAAETAGFGFVRVFARLSGAGLSSGIEDAKLDYAKVVHLLEEGHVRLLEVLVDGRNWGPVVGPIWSWSCRAWAVVLRAGGTVSSPDWTISSMCSRAWVSVWVSGLTEGGTWARSAATWGWGIPSVPGFGF